MSETRKWCPASWMDEVTPVQVGDPTDALHQFADSRWAIVCDDFREAGATEPSDDFTIEFVEPGQIVGWCYTEGRGHFTLTIASDGTWSLDAPMPEQATHWWDFDEAVGDNVDDLISVGELEPGEHIVKAYYWSDEIAHRFELEAGRGRFVQAAGAN